MPFGYGRNQEHGRGHGRGQGRGRGRGRRKRHIINFLQPCLLLMLREEKGHGYTLLNRLDQFGFDTEQLDASLVYRSLRDMEEGGLVISEWDDESQGPQRRVYEITPAGIEHLKEWMNDLQKVSRDIQMLIDIDQRYQNQITNDQKQEMEDDHAS
ncbi:MAG: helix-turn-helix transcriptional regulator [Anaerolineaceae bacterium]|nr:helix-turn-helix transcriptional regulator [Anaerolineaceae bacterium]